MSYFLVDLQASGGGGIDDPVSIPVHGRIVEDRVDGLDLARALVGVLYKVLSLVAGAEDSSGLNVIHSVEIDPALVAVVLAALVHLPVRLPSSG